MSWDICFKTAFSLGKVFCLCVCVFVWCVCVCGSLLAAISRQPSYGGAVHSAATRVNPLSFFLCQLEPELECKTHFNEILHYKIFMKILQKFSRQKWLSCWLHLCKMSFQITRKSQNFKRRKRMNITFLGAFCCPLDSDNKALN